MDLNLLYSDKRVGKSEPTHSSEIRTAFQRDFDRIVFSAAFRRLQNKTQVFPLPGSVFVHNRLTHSLEVASVGRTLGTLVGEFISNTYAQDLNTTSKEFYHYHLNHVIAAACLCHDIGNPAFGHSGEDAIARYFVKNEKDIKPHLNASEWQDLIQFEGNANAMRIITQQQNGKSEGGLLLTYATMASIAKYPCESIAKDKNHIHRKKFGFLQSEKAIFQDIALHSQMKQISHTPCIYARHPFVWLVEAADDICYLIIDLEDAHRLGFIDHAPCENLLKNLLIELGKDNLEKLNHKVNQIKDLNDKIAYLRAKTIGALIQQAHHLYCNQFETILQGNLNISLLSQIRNSGSALQEIMTFSEAHIYSHRAVVTIENAGYNVMYKLLDHFIPPIISALDRRSKADLKALQLMPMQFHYPDKSIYEQILGVLDFVSGMTDNYATDLYRKIQGIDIGMTI